MLTPESLLKDFGPIPSCSGLPSPQCFSSGQYRVFDPMAQPVQSEDGGLEPTDDARHRLMVSVAGSSARKSDAAEKLVDRMQDMVN